MVASSRQERFWPFETWKIKLTRTCVVNNVCVCVCPLKSLSVLGQLQLVTLVALRHRWLTCTWIIGWDAVIVEILLLLLDVELRFRFRIPRATCPSSDGTSTKVRSAIKRKEQPFSTGCTIAKQLRRKLTHVVPAGSCWDWPVGLWD